MANRKEKNPDTYTLGQLKGIADKQFPPPWSVIEAITRLEDYVHSYHNSLKHRPDLGRK